MHLLVPIAGPAAIPPAISVAGRSGVVAFRCPLSLAASSVIFGVRAGLQARAIRLDSLGRSHSIQADPALQSPALNPAATLQFLAALRWLLGPYLIIPLCFLIVLPDLQQLMQPQALVIPVLAPLPVVPIQHRAPPVVAAGSADLASFQHPSAPLGPSELPNE